jgi:hypothetical protein
LLTLNCLYLELFIQIIETLSINKLGETLCVRPRLGRNVEISYAYIRRLRWKDFAEKVRKILKKIRTPR